VDGVLLGNNNAAVWTVPYMVYISVNIDHVDAKITGEHSAVI